VPAYEFNIAYSRTLRLEDEAKGSGRLGKVPWGDELIVETSSS
jgi:hypothetical protein